jgi:hypothetical protein
MVNSIANGHRRVAPAMDGTPNADKNPADGLLSSLG